MANEVFDLTIRGDRELQDKLALLRAVLSPRANLRGATDILLARVQERFLKKQDRWYKPWRPSASGLARASRMGFPYGTLYDSGDMYHGLGVKKTGEFRWDIAANTDGRSPYASKYADPSSAQYRDYLGYNEDDVEAVEEYLEARISKAMRGMR